MTTGKDQSGRGVSVLKCQPPPRLKQLCRLEPHLLLRSQRLCSHRLLVELAILI